MDVSKEKSEGNLRVEEVKRRRRFPEDASGKRKER